MHPNQSRVPGHWPDGRLAQLVERLVYTENVGGSSPSSPTIPLLFETCTLRLLVWRVKKLGLLLEAKEFSTGQGGDVKFL